jgi:fibronectin type 3 domain-containing protein
MNIRPKFGALCAALTTLVASHAYAAVNSVLYIGNADNVEYSTFITTEFPGATWTQKATSLTADELIGGNLDRTGVFGGVSQTLKSYLQTFDLIIVGPPNNSANHVDGANGADWAAINKPILTQFSVCARASGGRPGLTSGDNNTTAAVNALQPAPAADVTIVATSDLATRLLTGVTDPTNLYDATGIDTINSIATYGTGQLIASFASTAPHHALIYWPAGSTIAAGHTVAANRAFFPLSAATLANLSADGRIVLKNLITALTTPPAVEIFLPPTNFAARGGISEVTLSWTASENATSYNIKRSTVSGGPYTTISTAGAVTGTTYTDSAVTNDTTYYYVVSAAKTGLESADSAQVTALPVAFIQPAKNILYVAGANDATLQALLTTGQFNNNTWTQKASGLDGDNVGGDLDRTAVLTGTNGGTMTVREYLQSFDLIIIGAPATSSNFVDGTGGTDWPELNKPVICLSYVVARSLGGRVGLFEGDYLTVASLIAPADSARASTTTLADAVLNGVTDATDLYSSALIDTVRTEAVYGNGEILSTITDSVTAVTHYGWAFWPAGATSPLGYPIVANKAFVPVKAGAVDLSASGRQAFANLFNQMFVVHPVPTAVLSASSLTAVAGLNKVDLSWTSSGGTGTFNIKRGVAAGGPHAIISSGVVTGTTYSDTTVVGGTTYYYVVSGVNTIPVQSTNSNEVEALPTAPVLTAVESWRLTKFNDSANTGSGADNADPDSDGITNLIEYATGTEPLTANAAPALVLGQAAGRLTVTFNRIADPLITYTVRGNNDLANAWTETPVFTSTGTENVADTQVISDSVLISAQPKRFLRLEITY